MLQRSSWQREVEVDERGFTLIELMASLTVLAIGIVGVIGVMNGSFRVAAITSARSKGVAVATKHIETVRAAPYDHLVAGGAVEESTDTVGGRTYTVKRAVTMADEATGATPIVGAYKRATIEVSWTDESGFHAVHQETLLYPGGKGRFVPVVTVPVQGNGRPLAPTNLVATAQSISGTTGVALSWTAPSEASNPTPVSYVVQYSTDATFGTYHEVTTTLPIATPTLLVTDLAASTLYHFRVASKAENGNLSSEWATAYNVTTGASLLSTCAIGTASVTPSAVYKKRGNENSGLVSNPVVSVNGVGACATTTLQARYSPRDGVNATLNLTRSGSIFTGTIVGTSQPWSVGEHPINIYDGTGTKRATMQLIVCDPQKKSCP